jgi:hypothetical protein
LMTFRQSARGLTRSHPADIWLPPVFAVDHVLTRGCVRDRRPPAGRIDDFGDNGQVSNR